MWLIKDREGAITIDQYKVGDFVSTDQFICKTPGRVPTGYGHESQNCHFQGGSIFNDDASGLFWVENQVSLDAKKLVMCKAWFDQWLYNQCVYRVIHYHGANGILAAEEFLVQLWGVTTRHPKTRMLALNKLFNASCIWHKLSWFMPPFIGQKEIQMISISVPLLWWNIRGGCITESRMLGRALLPWLWLPESALTMDLLHYHVWGCPVFVLEAKLQIDQKLPKWNQQACMSQFLDFQTNTTIEGQCTSFAYQLHLTPNFHLVFDDFFETVNWTGVDELSSSLSAMNYFNWILNYELSAEQELNEADNVIYQPPPTHMSGLIKLDVNKVTRIASNSAVAMMT